MVLYLALLRGLVACVTILFLSLLYLSNNKTLGECPRGVMVKAMVSRIVVREFVLLHSLSSKYPWERYDPTPLSSQLWVK